MNFDASLFQGTPVSTAIGCVVAGMLHFAILFVVALNPATSADLTFSLTHKFSSAILPWNAGLNTNSTIITIYHTTILDPAGDLLSQNSTRS